MAAIEIQIPPRPEYVGVVRLALASLARTSGIHEERVDDLKIAISEACTRAVVAHADSGAGAPIDVTWTADAGGVVVEVAGLPAPPAEDPNAVDTHGFDTRLTMSEALLKSLVDSYDIDAGPSGAVVRLSLNL